MELPDDVLDDADDELLVLWEELPELAEEDEEDVLPEGPHGTRTNCWWSRTSAGHTAADGDGQGVAAHLAVVVGDDGVDLIRSVDHGVVHHHRDAGLAGGPRTSRPLAYQRRFSVLAYLPLKAALKV